MRRSALALAAVLALAAAFACGDGTGDGGNGNGPSGGTPDANGSGPSFEELRQDLLTQLDGIGANIGAVPDDIRNQILGQCRALDEFADDDEVDALCTAMQRAMDRGDPGLIELVLENLATLEED